MSGAGRYGSRRDVFKPAASLTNCLQFRAVVGSLMLATALIGLDNTIVNTALPRIALELHGMNHLSWIITSFMLAQCSVMPIYGKLSDVYGRKRLLIFAIILFLVGSGLCGFSGSLVQLASFRAVQGVGASGITILSSTIAADLVKPEQRGRLLGLFMSAFAASSLAGPLVGGALTTWCGWRWIFYINLPLAFIVLALLIFFFNSPGKALKAELDYIGSILLIAAASCFILSLNLLGSKDPQSTHIIWLLLSGFIGFTALLIGQEHRAAHPLLPPKLFHHPRFVTCLLTSVSIAFPFFGAIVFMPLFFQAVGGFSPLVSGLAMTPQIIGLAISSRVGGWFLARKANHAILIKLGVSGVAMGLLLIGLSIEFSQNLICLEAALLVLGLGGGLVRPNLIIAAQTAVSDTEMGAATSTIIFVHTLAGTAGVACAQTIMNNRMRAFFMQHIQNQNICCGSSSLDNLSVLIQSQKNIVLAAYTASIAEIFLASALVSVVGVLWTLGLREAPKGRLKTRCD